MKRKINIDFKNTSGKTLFLKALYEDEKVTVLESQSSAMLNTFALANGLIYIPFNAEKIEKDQSVTVIPIQ